MSLGQSQRTGPKSGSGPGRANGAGPGVAPHDTTMKREKIKAKQLNPRGMIVGKFDVDGPLMRGEATFEGKVNVSQAIQELAEEVETEPLPIERKAHVQRYLDRLLNGDQEDE